MTPALLTSTSTVPSVASANARIDPRSDTSSWRTSTDPANLARAGRALAGSRTAAITVAPTRASSRAAISPMPLPAPVMITVRPSILGRSAFVHFGISGSFVQRVPGCDLLSPSE